MDPFMGIGTTAVVCVQLKKSFIGYEIDPEYFATSCERIETAISAGGK
jgi:DNA modification methylase